MSTHPHSLERRNLSLISSDTNLWPCHTFTNIQLYPFNICTTQTVRKLKKLIDLRRVNHLLRSDYSENNFPNFDYDICRSIFCKKDFIDQVVLFTGLSLCTDGWLLSVQLLASKLSSRTYAYTSLNKSSTGFSSFVKSYLVSFLMGNSCSHFMDDIGCGVQTLGQIVPRLRKKTDSLGKSGLRLKPHKRAFGMTSINFFGNAITPKGFTPETEKTAKFMKRKKSPATVRQLKRLVSLSDFLAHSCLT